MYWIIMKQDWLDAETFKDIIGQYTDLKRISSDRYLSLCPFHREKTASFTVFSTDKRYYCFGCGASGDVIKFLSDYNNWSFSKSLEYLRNDWGLDIPGKKGDDTDYHRTMSLIQSMYKQNLLKCNTNFFKSLGFEKEDLDHSEAGYTDESINRSLRRIYGDNFLKTIGLVNDSNNFVISNRLTFPLRNK